jgi:peptidoglycan/xylan/chitin deacetylase (PgdA/CDA1 family)
MAGRWNWDFEDERRPERSEPAEPAAAPDQETDAPTAPAVSGVGATADQGDIASQQQQQQRRRVQVRRRRVAAVLVLGVALAIVVAAVSGSHHGHAATASTGRTHARVAARPPSDPERSESKAVRSVLAYTPFVREGAGHGRDVALTFDDGPGPYTPEVLKVLERFKVRGTFFVIGRMLRYFGSSTVREIEDGDVIGDHTENHPLLATLSRHDQHEELFEQIARVEILGGRRPTLFRPPYGSFNATTLRQLHSLHLLMVLWSVDTDDYARPGVPVIVQRALEGLQPGAIILLHDGGGDRTQTIAALPEIIRGVRARGYRLVTVPQLLMDDPPPAGLPIPPNLSGD